MLKTSTRRILTAVAVAATVGAPVIVGPATAAQAKVNCSAGVWGGSNGWGQCTEDSVPGPRKWKLHTSCTLWPVSSGVLTGAGHVDISCPWPQSANSSYIEYIN